MIWKVWPHDLGGIDPNTTEISLKEEQELSSNRIRKDQDLQQVPTTSNEVKDSVMQAEASEEGECEGHSSSNQWDNCKFKWLSKQP